ncbi:DCC1-like thiol-disulfide oxidoreductase family protein [Vulgatibacter sp.]|uniref:DCC1-like thiol-disulfide oxidoreductase family protein n=1 Tax=Vulgatibacter sp. TaxID=1971226 RepID=UPI003566E10C
MKNWREQLRVAWLELDPRSLGIFRIGLAILLLGDLLRRVPDLAIWYSNQGLVPNHTQLWRPASEYMFSLFFLASNPGEAAFGFVLCGLVYLALLLGWKTRLFQVLSLVAAVSLHSRAVVLENGGDVVMNILVAWTCFLPLGKRFSLDALFASLRGRKEVAASELTFESRPAPSTKPVVSVAVFAVLLQFAVIYFFNTIHKNGDIWREGTVIHFALHQDRIVTFLGYALRDSFPIWLSQALSWGTLVIEGIAPLLLLSPFAVVPMRRAALVLLPALHLGFALFLNVGFFSPTMMTFYLLLPTAADWELAGRWFQRASRPMRAVWFDAGCGICFQVVRLLARLDGGKRLVFHDNGGKLPKGVTAELVERTIVVIDPATGRQTIKAAAFAEIFAMLPFGKPVAWLLRVPGLSAIADRVYDLVATNRREISMELGLAACGMPAPRPAGGVQLPEPEAPFRARLRRALWQSREALVVLVLVALGSQVINENWAVPKWMKVPQPHVLKAIVHYPRLFQGWSMFAPNPPSRDAVVVVDALTVDGRRIDPLNYAATGWTGEPWQEIPPRLDQDQFWCDYQVRIKGNGALHGPLKDWLLAHHKRTGNPKDRVVAFEAWFLEDESPLPGELAPKNLQRHKFLSHGNMNRAARPGVAKSE